MEMTEEMWWKINGIVHDAMKYAQELTEDTGSSLRPSNMCSGGSDITSWTDQIAEIVTGKEIDLMAQLEAMANQVKGDKNE